MQNESSVYIVARIFDAVGVHCIEDEQSAEGDGVGFVIYEYAYVIGQYQRYFIGIVHVQISLIRQGIFGVFYGAVSDEIYVFAL